MMYGALAPSLTQAVPDVGLIEVGPKIVSQMLRICQASHPQINDHGRNKTIQQIGKLQSFSYPHLLFSFDSQSCSKEIVVKFAM